MKNKSVCIVGAGVSGLATCKHLLERGFLPVVFEADQTVGGVWAHTPASTRLQSPKPEYQFSDFPWSETVTETCPDHTQVMEYIESYARRFDLLSHVRFGARVVAIDYVGVNEGEIAVWELWGGTGSAFGGGRGAWHVTVKHRDGPVEVHIMNFVILCLGRSSGLPNIPTFPKNEGPEIFNGKVIHSMDYSNMDSAAAAELVKGKRIVVIGYLKSALDIAADSANINGLEHPCTMIIRTKRWNIAHLEAWGIPLKYLYFNRFSELLLHKPGEGLMLSMLATMLSPLRWVFSKFVESYLLKTVPMKRHGMVPEYSFFEGIMVGLIDGYPEKFYDMVEDGRIILKPSKTFKFCKNGVLAEGETTPIEADLVIYGTGFKGDQKIREIFVSAWFQNIAARTEDTIIPLYRECIHPHIPQLAMVGYSDSITNLYTSEIKARWLACFLDDGFLLPSRTDMEKNITEWDKFYKKYSGSSSIYYRRSCFRAIHTWFNDQLCKDMGCNLRRKKGFFTDLFMAYEPSDYAGMTYSSEKPT